MKTLEMIFAMIGGVMAMIAAAFILGGGIGMIAGAAWLTFRWFL